MIKREAVLKFINDFAPTPRSLIERAYFETEKYDEFEELTKVKAYFKNSDLDEDEKEFDSCLPMWNTFWRVCEGCVYDFIMEHLQEVSSIGFRIYYDEKDDELYLGIDGCGYDFLSAHWEKLYDLKGIKWHDENEAAA